MAENVQYKSDAFSMLMQIPKYALDVYNSMYHTNYDNPDDLEVFMLENGISLSIRNDASFIIYNELVCEAININPNMNNELKTDSYVLKGYCIFVEKVRKYVETGTLDEALKRAISECIDEDVLSEFFIEYGDEVRKVTVLDFTFEKRLELADYNGEKRGIEIGEKRGTVNSILTLLGTIGEVPNDVCDKLLSEDDNAKLMSWLKLAAKADSVEEFMKELEKE